MGVWVCGGCGEGVAKLYRIWELADRAKSKRFADAGDAMGLVCIPSGTVDKDTGLMTAPLSSSQAILCRGTHESAGSKGRRQRW